MKPFLKIAAGIVAGLLMSTDMFGQAQITTKKEKIKDFTTKTTKIVLTGDPILDDALQDCIGATWTVSPYEFCTMQEFEALKKNAAFYFLIKVKGQFRKETEPGIDMFTLVKGGEGADKSIGDMLEIVSIPLRASEEPSGREIVFLSALLKCVQEQALSMTKSEVKAYTSLAVSAKVTAKLWNKRIIISKDDLAPQVDGNVLRALDEDIVIEDDSEIVDDAFADGEYNSAVSYIIAPSEPVDGSWCYKMLIGTDTHDIYYFKKHKITSSKGAGFLASDIKALNRIMKRKL